MKKAKIKKNKVTYYSNPTPTQLEEFWATGSFTYPVMWKSRLNGNVYIKSGSSILIKKRRAK